MDSPSPRTIKKCIISWDSDKPLWNYSHFKGVKQWQDLTLEQKSEVPGGRLLHWALFLANKHTYYFKKCKETFCCNYFVKKSHLATYWTLPVWRQLEESCGECPNYAVHGNIRQMAPT